MKIKRVLLISVVIPAVLAAAAAAPADNSAHWPVEVTSRFNAVYGSVDQGVGLVAGDSVGMFDVNGNCYGAGIYNGTYYYLSAFMYEEENPDIPDDYTIPGFKNGDVVVFRAYREATGDEIEIATASGKPYIFQYTGRYPSTKIDLASLAGTPESTGSKTTGSGLPGSDSGTTGLPGQAEGPAGIPVIGELNWGEDEPWSQAGGDDRNLVPSPESEGTGKSGLPVSKEAGPVEEYQDYDYDKREFEVPIGWGSLSSRGRRKDTQAPSSYKTTRQYMAGKEKAAGDLLKALDKEAARTPGGGWIKWVIPLFILLLLILPAAIFRKQLWYMLIFKGRTEKDGERTQDEEIEI